MTCSSSTGSAVPRSWPAGARFRRPLPATGIPTLPPSARMAASSPSSARPWASPPGCRDSPPPPPTAGGRVVAFVSKAMDLVAGQNDTAGTLDVFLHDLTLGSTVLVSRQSDDIPTVAHGYSHSPRISADGSQIVFARESFYSRPFPQQS